METRTVFIISIIMMLLNGGMLGILHRGLSSELQPAAKDWRIGTLLIAGGSILVAIQDVAPIWLVLPWGNAWFALGVALYWRAVRRFDNRAETHWIFVPTGVTALGILWFTVVTPSLTARVALACLVWGGTLLFAAESLYRNRLTHPEVSRFALIGTMLLTAIFMAWRGIYFVVYMQGVESILQAGNWLNTLTPLSAAVLPVIGTTAFLVLCSERLRAEWQRAATTDFLTNLPNRRTISDTGIARFNAAQRAGTGFAAAVVDIDHFKSVNDRFGHDVGDLALQHVAAVLAHNCRGPNMVGRQGGEEFVALLEASSVDEALVATERMRAAVEAAPLQLQGEGAPVSPPLQITVSIGIGQIAPGDRSFDDVLRRADKALYVAKENGRNRVELCS
jgi:diguanylate cyclase (GGDEF)-like protein